MNDAIGGATSGTLNLTQTAIGGRGAGPGFGGTVGGSATSILIGTNPSGASTYNLTANARGGMPTFVEVTQPQRLTPVPPKSV